ncbi:MAG: heavy metal translocating P-type ATPase [Planctomycetota bacterium]
MDGDCVHCGLPVPKNRGRDRFCCVGCAAVYELIRSEGLERFYELGGSPGLAVGRAPRVRQRDWLPVLIEAGRQAGGQVQLTVDLQGIRCAACVWLLQELWRRRDGAGAIEINPALGRARLSYDEERLSIQEFFDSCDRLGYSVGPASKAVSNKDDGLLRRLGVCAALALNAMMFALARYFGLGEEGGELDLLFEQISFGLASIALLVGGTVFFRAALSGLRQRVLHLDLPISMGIGLAYGSSALAFFLPSLSGESYFDTVTIFIALMLVGRYLQQRAVQRNRDYLLENDGAEHLYARRVQGKGLERVQIKAIEKGDELFLAPGDLLPVRASLIDSGASFSLDWISGESLPRSYALGEQVSAGAFLCGSRPQKLRAEASAEDSGLLELLATPAGDRDEMRGRGRFWLLLNRIYVGLVLGLAGIAAILWACIDPSRIVGVTTAVLVVTCPCALGLATPLAFDMGLARLRRHGVYVRSVALLEKLRHLRKIVLDKTGTVTWGELEAQVLRSTAGRSRDVLFSMAQSSNHPVSRAIAASVSEEARYISDLVVEEVPGQGLVCRDAGHVYRLGGDSFALGDLPPGSNQEEGLCSFTRDGQVEACFQVDEDYRPGTGEEIASLSRQGLELYLCSGDAGEKVQRAADELGIPRERAHAEMRPEDKVSLLRKLDQSDCMMVGDGINDAPAFDVAFCAGTPAVDRPVMPSRADFFYTGGGIAALRWLLGMSRLFHSVVTSNLWLAGLYNLVALSFCFAGLMSPLLCALLMPLSSILLIGHSAWRMRESRVFTEVPS